MSVLPFILAPTQVQLAPFFLYGANILTIIISAAMLIRTFRKDTDDKLDKKADRTEMTTLQQQVAKKVDVTVFDLLKDEFKESNIRNEENHKEIKKDLKELITEGNKTLSEKIELNNKVLIGQMQTMTDSVNTLVKTIRTNKKGK